MKSSFQQTLNGPRNGSLTDEWAARAEKPQRGYHLVQGGHNQHGAVARRPSLLHLAQARRQSPAYNAPQDLYGMSAPGTVFRTTKHTYATDSVDELQRPQVDLIEQRRSLERGGGGPVIERLRRVAGLSGQDAVRQDVGAAAHGLDREQPTDEVRPCSGHKRERRQREDPRLHAAAEPLQGGWCDIVDF